MMPSSSDDSPLPASANTESKDKQSGSSGNTPASTSNYTSNQLRRGLAYNRSLPKFLQQMYDATGYQDPEKQIQNKFRQAMGDDDEVPDDHAFEEGADDGPVIVVLKEGKHLSAEQVKEIRDLNKADSESVEALRPEEKTSKRQLVDLREVAKKDAKEVEEPEQAAFSARPLFKRSKIAPTDKRRPVSASPAAANNAAQKISNKKLLSFEEED